MIRNQKIERSRKRKESKAKSVKSQVSSAVSRDGGANSAAPAREQQAEPKQPGASGNGLEQSRAAELQHAHNSELHDHQSQSQSQLQAGALAREQREREATSSFASSGGTLADSRANGPMSGEQSQTSYGSFLQHEQYELQKAHSHNGGGSEEQSSGYQSGSLQNKRLSNSSLAPLDSGAQSYKWGAAGSGRHSPSAPNAGRDEPYHQHQSAVEPEQQTMFARPANGSNHSSPYLDNSTPAMDEADAGYARPVDRVIARADQILRDSARGMPPDKSSARRAAQKADARDAAVAAAAAAMDSGEKVRTESRRVSACVTVTAVSVYAPRVPIRSEPFVLFEA